MRWLDDESVFALRQQTLDALVRKPHQRARPSGFTSQNTPHAVATKAAAVGYTCSIMRTSTYISHGRHDRLPSGRGDPAQTHLITQNNAGEGVEATKRLTTAEHWSEVNDPAAQTPETSGQARKSLLRRLLGGGSLKRLGPNYSQEYFRRMVVELVGDSPGKRSLEMGSAPGNPNLSVALQQKLHCEPFGVEYTAVGARINREVFARSGVNPDNVFEDDFFNDNFVETHCGLFDVVMSRGFIEHSPTRATS